jgi:uncharacterized membrane protein
MNFITLLAEGCGFTFLGALCLAMIYCAVGGIVEHYSPSRNEMSRLYDRIWELEQKNKKRQLRQGK